MLALRRKSSVSPFQPFFDMSKEMESFLNTAYGENASVADFSPSIDIYSEKEQLLLRADLPGMTEKQIEISVNDGVLTLKGERLSDAQEMQDRCVRSERVFGTFMRQFTLPKNIDADQIKARFENGVLNIDMPYNEDVKELKIPIEAS